MLGSEVGLSMALQADNDIRSHRQFVDRLTAVSDEALADNGIAAELDAKLDPEAEVSPLYL
jgi:hypothetical protein